MLLLCDCICIKYITLIAAVALWVKPQLWSVPA